MIYRAETAWEKQKMVSLWPGLEGTALAEHESKVPDHAGTLTFEEQLARLGNSS